MFKIVGYERNDMSGGSNGQYVTVYEHANYQGKSKQLPIGRYGVLPFKNDSISSVQVPDGLRVTLYEHGNFGGRPRTYSSSISNLGDFNDATSSIIVEPAEWYDKLRPDQRIDFEKYIPPEITEKIRGKVQEKMKEETPGIVRWTGIHKSEMAKDKAREKIRDMLPNFLEDKGIEDYLVGRQPIGTGFLRGTNFRSMRQYLVGNEPVAGFKQQGGRRSKVNWPFIDVVKKVIPPLGYVVESAAELGHTRPGQEGKERDVSIPSISTANPFGLALGMTQGGLEMAHLAKRLFGSGNGAYPKCKPPRERIGHVLKDGNTKACLIPCTELKYPKRSKRCSNENEKDDDDDLEEQKVKLERELENIKKLINPVWKEMRACKNFRTKRCRDLRDKYEDLNNKYNKVFREYWDVMELIERKEENYDF